jgi:Putative metal-binding motif
VLRPLVIALAALLAAPAVAAAGTVSSSGGVVTFAGDGGHERVTVDQAGGSLTFTGDVAAGAGCPGAVCPTAGVTAIVMRGGDGLDSFTLNATVTIGATLDGGAGADVLRGGAGADRLEVRDGVADGAACGAGADTVVADTIDSISGCESVDASAALERDADRDGWGRPADCNDAAAHINPAAADVPQNGVDENCAYGDELFADRDGDGTPSPLDCNDSDPGQHPRNREIPGNDKDDDCDGRSFPLPLLQSTVSNRWRQSGQDLIGVRFVVSDVPAGTQIELRCFGFRCPFDRVRQRVKKNKKFVSLNRHVRGKRFLKGRRIELILTHRRYFGRQIRYDVVGGPVPEVETLCRKVGGRPTNC